MTLNHAVQFLQKLHFVKEEASVPLSFPEGQGRIAADGGEVVGNVSVRGPHDRQDDRSGCSVVSPEWSGISVSR